MPSSSSSQRAARRTRLVEMLSDGFAGTQDEIVTRLAKAGFKVTQTTVSRDLEDIGAIRRHDNDRIVYALPDRNGPPVGFGRRVFAELILDAQASGNMVVVRTYPGMASTVAAVIDSNHIPGALGTIAGDDTVFVVADENSSGRTLAKAIATTGEREDKS